MGGGRVCERFLETALRILTYLYIYKRTLFCELVGFPLLEKQKKHNDKKEHNEKKKHVKKEAHPAGISCSCKTKLRRGRFYTYVVDFKRIQIFLELIAKSQCYVAQDSDKKIQWNDGIVQLMVGKESTTKTIRDYFK